MKHPLHLYNTLSGNLEPFVPLHALHVGLYVCGPTVYDAPHLGHGRSAVVFDMLVRWLKHLDYKVRYVRNITDVGHLTEGGKDKLAKRAQAEKSHPMEVATKYTRAYHRALDRLNVLPPDLEPLATGHVPEQIALVEKLLQKGLAYEAGGSVYFDLAAYDRRHGYGQLSGAKLEEMLGGGRVLQGQVGKRHSVDFALWKQADDGHVMRWPSPWGEGYPGWHLECTAMSSKYLGVPFDIHGGGRDLAFPHHECEIAQAQAAYGKVPAKYWVHHNMVTLGGQKMSKSTSNFITLEQCFSGEHELLSGSYKPMVFRFLVLQAHYRSVLGVTDDALRAAEQGYHKLMSAWEELMQLSERLQGVGSGTPDPAVEEEIGRHCQGCIEAMHEDLHTPKVVAHLFQLAKHIDRCVRGDLPLTALSKQSWKRLTDTYVLFIKDVLGLMRPLLGVEDAKMYKRVIDSTLDKYKKVKEEQDYVLVDEYRKQLKEMGIAVRDTPQGVRWYYTGRS